MVYEIAKANEAFPEFMSDVESLTVLSSENNTIISDWVGLITSFGIRVKWRQEDVWDDSQRACAFRQVEGDYDKLEGAWVFTEEDGGTRFDSSVTYEYTVPGLGPLVKKVVHNLVIKNMEGALNAIKERAENWGP